MATCRGQKRNGEPCQSPIVLDNGYCQAHQSQAKTGTTAEDDQHEVTLVEFIEENHKLLTVLGVFTAMTVFAGGLPLEWPGSMLAFLFMALAVLVWLQLLGRSLRVVDATTSMALFVTFISMAALYMLLYWLLAFRPIWHQYLAQILAMLLFAVLLSAYKWGMRRYSVYDRFFRRTPSLRRHFVAMNVASLFVLCIPTSLVAIHGASGLNAILDAVYQDVTEATPTPTITMPPATSTIASSSTPTPAPTPSPRPQASATASAMPTETVVLSDTPTATTTPCDRIS